MGSRRVPPDTTYPTRACDSIACTALDPLVVFEPELFLSAGYYLLLTTLLSCHEVSLSFPANPRQSLTDSDTNFRSSVMLLTISSRGQTHTRDVTSMHMLKRSQCTNDTNGQLVSAIGASHLIVISHYV